MLTLELSEKMIYSYLFYILQKIDLKTNDNTLYCKTREHEKDTVISKFYFLLLDFFPLYMAVTFLF